MTEENKQLNLGTGAVNFNTKGHTARKRKWKEPILRDYTQEAADFIAKAVSKEHDEEVALGFNIKDRDSIINFDLEYTPIGENILIKRMVMGNVILADSVKATDKDKFMVVEVSPEISRPLQPGDIVSVGGPHMEAVPMAERKIKGVKLIEVSAYAVAGIYISIDEYQERLAKQREDIRREENAGSSI